MQSGSFVQIHLTDPKEQWFGRLERLNEAGAVIRGIESRLIEIYKYQFQKEEQEVFPQTLFFPMRRVERIYLDEQLGAVPSMLQNILGVTGFEEDQVFPLS